MQTNTLQTLAGQSSIVIETAETLLIQLNTSTLQELERHGSIAIDSCNLTYSAKH